MRQKIGRACMVLGALLILAAAALLAYNKWDASRADKASQEVLGELEHAEEALDVEGLVKAAVDGIERIQV